MRDYPDVKGMSEDVVFFPHKHKEDGGQDSVGFKSQLVRGMHSQYRDPRFQDVIAGEVAAFLSELNHFRTAVISVAKLLSFLSRSPLSPRFRLPTGDWAVFDLCGAPQRLCI